LANALIDLLIARFSDAILEVHAAHGDETVIVAPNQWHAIHAVLRDDPAADMQMLVDLTAVDFPRRLPRFDVVTHLLSLRLGHRLRVKTRVGDADGEGATVSSLTPLWASASWAERECYDMMGVRFIGHPDLRRILTYREFEGHPLRKDYPAELVQPLVPYREVDNIDKLAPFGPEEGMSFGRQTHHQVRGTEAKRD
jgi:NADH-quinone oxidoreductase subunit C